MEKQIQNRYENCVNTKQNLHLIINVKIEANLNQKANEMLLIS